MLAENPFAKFRHECENILAEALERTYPEIIVAGLAFEKPVNPEYGELASSICFELAKQAGKKPIEMAGLVIKNIPKSELDLIKSVEPAGAGYINFHADSAKLTALTLESVIRLDKKYGFVRTDKPKRIIVEHTSVNPIHPIHIGQARNPMLGDTLGRLLKARGHAVRIHFYVDDVGRQTSVVAYGYSKLGTPKLEGKTDHWIGRIYTITSCLIEINLLKRELERAKHIQAQDEVVKINGELDEWVSICADLQNKHSRLFEDLFDRINQDRDPETAVSELNKAYEEGDLKARELVRGVSELCFDGFRQTLNRVGVSYDSWDWESDFVSGGHVAEVLGKLRKSPFVFMENGVLEFDAEKVVQRFNLKPRLGIREDHEIPSLTLARSDGTTLYTTRDVAYTLWKFQKADRVINVIGMEQSLAQLQLKIALYALGFDKHADNLSHFAYNLVTMPESRMSSRKGQYITFDEVMDEAVKRAYEEVSKRSPQLPEEEKQEIATFVGLGAVRYALVEVDASKPVAFTWDRVLNFEKNSAPYIQYTHARACSILRRANKKPGDPEYGLLTEKLEKEIVLTLATFPDTFIEATEYLKPNLVAEYADSLADKFNTFYNAFPVIKAEPPQLADTRLVFVNAVRIVLRNALQLIGVVPPEKM